MNKREFLAGSVGAVVAANALAQPAAQTPAQPTTGRRAHGRLPDLVEAPGAATYEAYVGERFAIVGDETTLVLQGVRRLAGCESTEQFSLAFAQAAGAPGAAGTRLLQHASTGQRVALHLEPTPSGYAAHFNLLA